MTDGDKVLWAIKYEFWIAHVEMADCPCPFLMWVQQHPMPSFALWLYEAYLAADERTEKLCKLNDLLANIILSLKAELQQARHPPRHDSGRFDY